MRRITAAIAAARTAIPATTASTRRRGQQQRERMGELLRELARPAAAAAAHELVAAVADEPPVGLALGEAVDVGVQVAQEQVGLLRGVDGERLDRAHVRTPAGRSLGARRGARRRSFHSSGTISGSSGQRQRGRPLRRR